MSDSDSVTTLAPPDEAVERRPGGDAEVTDGLTKHFGKRLAVDHIDIELPIGVVTGFVVSDGEQEDGKARMP